MMTTLFSDKVVLAGKDGPVVNVLVLSSLHPQTGNNSTAKRIRRLLGESGFQATCVDSSSITDRVHFLALLKRHAIHVVLGLHAYRSGRWLIDCPVPYCVILGGTDINHHYHDPLRMNIMTEAIKQARYVVAFNSSMKAQAESLWTCMRQTVKIIPQSVMVYPTEHPSVDVRCLYRLPADVEFVILACGIRPEKDPLYLLEAFSDWHCLKPKQKDIYLLIVGPVLVTQYGDIFLETVKRYPGVLYIGPQNQPDTHTLIRDSYALVNSSISEGQSVAMLEAMVVGTPVIARDILSNQVLIQHGVNGLLYSTPQDFLNQLETLMDDEKLGLTLTANAKRDIQNCHSPEEERSAYTHLVTEMTDHTTKCTQVYSSTDTVTALTPHCVEQSPRINMVQVQNKELQATS